MSRKQRTAKYYVLNTMLKEYGDHKDKVKTFSFFSRI